jgi:hypothetical protein
MFMRKLEQIVFAVALAFLCLQIGVLVGKNNATQQPQPNPIHHYHTTIKYDTISSVQYVDKWNTKTDTAYFPLVQNITDTVQVEVPIYTYKFDTLGVLAVVSGYGVELDTLQVQTKIITDSVIVPYHTKKWHWGAGFALGFGYVR